MFLPRISVAADVGVVDTVASSPERQPAMAFGPDGDPGSMRRMRRHIKTRSLVRVGSPHGTFVGRVTGVQDSGLAFLAPRDDHPWSGPRELLRWNDIRTVEVRKRNPLLTAAVGSIAGALILGGVGYANFEQNDGALGDVFILGMVGAVYGAPIGFVVGIAVPIWEPLYQAPGRRFPGEEVER